MLFKLFNDLGMGFNVNTIICIAICVVIPYFIGSLNFGIIFSKMFYKEDVRESGSGNAGATNMLRTYGKKAGIFTFLCDGLKTAAAMALSYLIMPVRWIEMGMFIAGIACMVGHSFPAYYKFKGGKGVACFTVVVLMTSIRMGMWYLFVILFAMFAILVIGTKFVSLGSIICSLVYPILLNRLNGGNDYTSIEIFAVIAGLFVVFQHRENLKRLLTGTENKISLSKKKKAEENKNV